MAAHTAAAAEAAVAGARVAVWAWAPRAAWALLAWARPLAAQPQIDTAVAQAVVRPATGRAARQELVLALALVLLLARLSHRPAVAVAGAAVAPRMFRALRPPC